MNLPQSEHASARSLLLPLYPQMTDMQQDDVVTVLLSTEAVSSTLLPRRSNVAEPPHRAVK